MAEAPNISSAMGTSATLYWDGQSGIWSEGAPPPIWAGGRPPAFQAKALPAAAQHDRPYWTTAEIAHVPVGSSQAIAWEQEAALMTFSLAAVLLPPPAQSVLPGTTGELVWLPWPEQPTSPTPAVHPALLVQAPSALRQAPHVTLVPALPAHDPLLHHIALVLQATVTAAGVAGQLYAAALTTALVVHVLSRYAASCPPPRLGTGGLAPATLRRTLVYIQDHLEQALALPTLAAVAQMSPAHFARQFKHTTGQTPHQYVLTCRMAAAKQLLTETDLPLSEIGPQVGCADQSHFTALFRKHVAMPPSVYRHTTRR